MDGPGFACVPGRVWEIDWVVLSFVSRWRGQHTHALVVSQSPNAMAASCGLFLLGVAFASPLCLSSAVGIAAAPPLDHSTHYCTLRNAHIIPQLSSWRLARCAVGLAFEHERRLIAAAERQRPLRFGQRHSRQATAVPYSSRITSAVTRFTVYTDLRAGVEPRPDSTSTRPACVLVCV